MHKKERTNERMQKTSIHNGPRVAMQSREQTEFHIQSMNAFGQGLVHFLAEALFVEQFLSRELEPILWLFERVTSEV